MAWKLPNGKVTRVPKGVQIGDVKYPASIFRRWSKNELNAIGIYPFREERVPQWYRTTGSTDNVVDGEVVRTHTTTKQYTNDKAKEMQVDKVKAIYISENRRALELEDFYDAVGDTVTKKLWSDYVTALKNNAKTLKDQVNAAGTYDQIINLEFTWTEAPDYGSI